MLHFQFIVEPYLSGVRVDSFLARHLRNYTNWRLHRMVAEGLVRVDGLPAQRDQRVRSGQLVEIQLAEPPDKLLHAGGAPTTILYEDPWLLVIDKPAGWIAHPVGEFHDGTLSDILQEHLDRQTRHRGLLRPGIVHRLDRMTSGLMVVAKEHRSHRMLSRDFQKSRPQKTYIAVVHGLVTPHQQSILAPIGRTSAGHSVLMSTASDAIRKRAAHTDVRVLKRGCHQTLVECRLHTGRNHQIRVHLASVGHPVVADPFYGPSSMQDEPGRERSPEDQRHALHAWQLKFQHPVLQTPLSFQALPSDDFWSLAEPELRPETTKQPASQDTLPSQQDNRTTNRSGR